MKITLKRTGDYITFLNEKGNAVASLHDGQDHILFDPFANSGHLWGVEPKIDYQQEFEAIGLDVLTARQIDRMPVPQESAWNTSAP